MRQLKLISQRSGDKKVEIETSVFFYHHWFDHQVTHINVEILFFFIHAILKQVNLVLNKNNKQEMFELHLIMHEGDFIYEPSGKKRISETEILRYLKKFEYYSTITIHRYHHDFGHPVWDRVLNDENLYKLLCETNINKSPEEYILDQFDPARIDHSFKNFLIG